MVKPINVKNSLGTILPRDTIMMSHVTGMHLPFSNPFYVDSIIYGSTEIIKYDILYSRDWPGFIWLLKKMCNYTTTFKSISPEIQL